MKEPLRALSLQTEVNILPGATCLAQLVCARFQLHNLQVMLHAYDPLWCQLTEFRAEVYNLLHIAFCIYEHAGLEGFTSVLVDEGTNLHSTIRLCECDECPWCYDTFFHNVMCLNVIADSNTVLLPKYRNSMVWF